MSGEVRVVGGENPNCVGGDFTGGSVRGMCGYHAAQAVLARS